MKRIIILFLIILLDPSCKEDPLQFGTCEVHYYNSSGPLDLTVKVTDQDSISLQYSITSGNNIISIPLEAGDSYIIKTGGMRTDSIYNVRFVWSDNNVIYYSFMFDDIACDKYSNRIRIDL